MNHEPYFIKKQDNFIYGVHQNPDKYPDPECVYSVDEQGYKIDKPVPTQEMIISMYWGRKRKQIALIGMISAFIPFSILTQTTGLFDMIFINVIGLAVFAFETLVGLIV